MLEIGGLALLPEWPVFAAFALAGLALNLVPGADMAFVMTNAAQGGRRAGVIAALGIGAGTFVHILAAAVGLSALLASSQAAFNVIKYAGALYLLWIAFTLVRRGRGAVSPAAAARPARVFRTAILVNILNPKVALFFLAFLPQFVDPAAASPALQILALGLWFDLVGTLVNVVVALATATGAAALRRSSWIGTAARWFAASIMTALALQLALAARRPI
jgi:threonine/homoserine/homoserine lactone efflux protein